MKDQAHPFINHRMNHRTPAAPLFPTLLLVLALGALPLPGAAPRAQERGAKPSESESLQRLTEVEQSLQTLQSRLVQLEDRINALLGEEDAEKVYEIPAGASPVRGRPEARLTLVVFGDYQSDYATRSQAVINRLVETYPNDLRIVYKHYPLRTIHPQAHDAALTAIAAQKQGKFWEMHELLYRNSRILDSALYPFLAEQIGLDLVQFERDRTSLSALEMLTADEKEAARLSVAGVPTLFLNGRRLRTWRLDYVKGEIDHQLTLIRPAAPGR